jgi:hypothetical protein
MTYRTWHWSHWLGNTAALVAAAVVLWGLFVVTR